MNLRLAKILTEPLCFGHVGYDAGGKPTQPGQCSRIVP